MSIAVLDLDISCLPDKISGLERYLSAFILFRYKGKPLGSALIPVRNGRVIPVSVHRPLPGPVLNKLWKERLYDLMEWDQNRPSSFIPPKVTVAICTRNRPEDLKRCMEALMKLPDDGQEIMVVDNCPSNEDTMHLVATYRRARYVREPRRGLNVARNRALREASCPIVAFSDDDAVPDENWLRALTRNFDRDRVACVTGLTMPLELESEGQKAFEKYNSFSKGFEKRIFNSLHNPLNTGKVGAGANMALRKSALELVGEFDEALDAGTPTHSGGDHEYFSRILRAGYYIVYDPEALNWHKHRRTMEETKHAVYGYGVGVYAYWTKLFWHEKELSVLKLPWGWFFNNQLPSLIRSVFKRHGYQPLELVLAELKGCLNGPAAYFKSRRELKKYKR
jgi:GT2 family glycosyltransferase